VRLKNHIAKVKRTAFCFILVFSCSLLACKGQTWLWGREGIPLDSVGSDILSDHTLVIDKNGNAYITGIMAGIQFGTLAAPYGTPTIIKYNANGNVIWLKQASPIGTFGFGYGYSIALDGAGNIYLTGNFGDTIAFGTNVLRASGYCMFVAKYDSNGNVIWARQATETIGTESYGNAIAVDYAGNAYITGNFIDTVHFASFTLIDTLNEDVYTVKYDSSGNVLWAKQAQGSGSISGGIGYSIASDKQGNAYVTGLFTGVVAFASDTLSTAGSANMFLCKYYANGKVDWVKQPKISNLSAGAEGTSVAIDGLNNIWLTGTFQDTACFGADTIKASSGGFFLAKYDTSGKVLLVKQSYALDGNGWGVYSVYADTLKEGGGVLAFEGMYSPPYSMIFGGDTFKLATKYQSATGILKFDSLGNTICGTLFTEGDEDDGDAVALDKSGKYTYFEGDLADTTIFNKDTLIYGGDDIFLARWQPCAESDEGVNELTTNSGEVRVYPNPSNGVFTVAIKNSQLKIKNLVEVYDMLGEKVLTASLNPSEGGTSNTIITLPFGEGQGGAGIYLYRVISETGQLIGTGKLIKE
jgi:hypothetical protein